MQKKEIATDKPDDPPKTDQGLFVAAYALSKRIPITWRIVGVAVVGVLVLAAVARWLPDMKERLKFFTDSALGWLVFVIVAVQAYIYQWQAKIMGDALIIGNSALVGVHSIESDFPNAKSISIRLENVGGVPADKISIFVEMVAGMPEEFRKSTPNIRPVILETITEDFGSMQLLPGSFKMRVAIAPKAYFSNEEINLVVQGHAPLLIRGHIEYQDGFKQGTQRTSFAFEYLYRETKDEWLPTSPEFWNDIFESTLTIKKWQANQKSPKSPN